MENPPSFTTSSQSKFGISPSPLASSSDCSFSFAQPPSTSSSGCSFSFAQLPSTSSSGGFVFNQPPSTSSSGGGGFSFIPPSSTSSGGGGGGFVSLFSTSSNTSSTSSSSFGFSPFASGNAWCKYASPHKEDDSGKRISFLSGLFAAFKEQIHTDLLLKPNNGPCIPAHKALLAARSETFKNVLEWDSFKAPAGEHGDDPDTDTDTITLSELNTEELGSFLEFLYTGNLPNEKWEKHVYSLYDAGSRYGIPYLLESCERYLMNSLNTSNALEILELSDAHSRKTMKETTLNFIVKNMMSIVSSKKYEDFVSSNPQLCLQITRSYVDANWKETITRAEVKSNPFTYPPSFYKGAYACSNPRHLSE